MQLKMKFLLKGEGVGWKFVKSQTQVAVVATAAAPQDKTIPKPIGNSTEGCLDPENRAQVRWAAQLRLLDPQHGNMPFNV